MKSLEIFSGAGGLAKGLELSGFKHAAFVEYNKHACASLSENFDRKKVFFGDIQDFDLTVLDNIDVVAGGPPCQPFSLGGKHRADEDHRDMFPFAINAIEHLMPKAFVFENVKGLLRNSFADYFEYIILRLTFPGFKAGKNDDWRDHLIKLRKISLMPYAGVRYDVKYELINAADYGVPQVRERVIIIGLRSDLNLNWSFPEPTHSQDRLLWDIHVSGEYWEQHRVSAKEKAIVLASTEKMANRIYCRYGLLEPEHLPWKTIRDAVSNLPPPKTKHYLEDHAFRDGARTYAGHTGSEYDWPSKTIKAGDHGVPGGENMIRFPDDSVRYLTILEAKRLQTFPDDFVVKGAWGEAMRQLGNAVPVKLANIIGDHLYTLLSAKTARKVLRR
ncbi:C-5 cytosine-specific DNA methylase [gamma proteobacterium HdN1]|nr:C-5 cytosine-specific DNA methylase [gamma proteobacterium HdN1]